jgi:hypothetical protein
MLLNPFWINRDAKNSRILRERFVETICGEHQRKNAIQINPGVQLLIKLSCLFSCLFLKMTLFFTEIDGYSQNRQSPKLPFLQANNDFRDSPARSAKALFIGSIPIAASNFSSNLQSFFMHCSQRL